MSATKTTKTKTAAKRPSRELVRVPEPDPNPIWTTLVAERGELYAPVDTEYTVLAAQAVLALAERSPA